MVVHAPEVIAAKHRSERAVQRKDFESVAREIELANDFRPQQRHNVRTFRKKEARNDFFRHSGATKYMAALQRKHLLPRFSQVGGVDKPVVAATDDNDVVVLRHAE